MSKKQIIIYSAVTLLVIIICAVLPLGFVSLEAPKEENNEPLTLSQKADVFLTYWNEGHGDGRGGYEYEELSRSDMTAESLALCADIKNKLWDNFTVDDAVAGFEDQGETYFKMTDDEGREIRFYHVWYRWAGNWNNWFNLCADADTGTIYYFYVSSAFRENSVTKKETAIVSNTLTGAAANNIAVAPYTDSVEMANLWSRFCGYECASVIENGEYNDDGTPIYTAIYIAEDEALRYNISCKYYPRSLLDIKFTVR